MSYAASVNENIQDLCDLGSRFKRIFETDDLTGSIREECLCLKKKEARKQLEEIPVERLKELRSGIRADALAEQGITSLRMLFDLSDPEILAVRGIGEKQLVSIRAAEEQFLMEMSAMSGITLKEENASLIRKLWQYLKLQLLQKDAAGLLQILAEELENTRNIRIRSRLHQMFSLPKTKRVSAEAEARLTAFLASESCARIRRFAGLSDDVYSVSEEEALEDYRKNSAPYYACLEKLAGSAEYAERIYSSIPLSLAAEVQKEELALSAFRGNLRAYQEFGAKYILHMKKVLLGDEMGLGKTVQAIAVMAHLNTSSGLSSSGCKFLVVCPASVMMNWMREIRKFSELTAVLLHGKQWEAAFEKWDCVAVTSFEMMGKLTDLIDNTLKLALLVIDEAQYIKNPDAKRTQRIRKLEEESERILLMTGTPIENRTDEMCELIRFIRPELADKLLEYAFCHDTAAFREALFPVYLRRKREDVLKELPPLTQTDEWCVMSDADLRRYRSELEAGNFMGMRRAAMMGEDSAKLERLKELCAQARDNGNRIVIFSFFRETLELIAGCVPFDGMITGSVPAQDRQNMVDRFEQGKNGILLCQILSGGIGLNLQSASVVIFCEVQIKPSITKQALSRVYRMGQSKPVFVYHLLSEDTVDAQILDLLKEKQAVFDEYADESAAAEASDNLVSKEWIQSVISAERQKYLPAIVPSRTGEAVH